MKKVLAVMLTLVLAFTFCIPSFAALADDIQDEITGNSEATTDDSSFTWPEGLPDISNMDITPTMASVIVQVMLSQGITKADLLDVFAQMYNDGMINEESYNNLTVAVENADESTTAPDDYEVPAVAQRIIDALHQEGVTDEQMKSTVDDLYQRGLIPQDVYEEIIRILDAQESTTASDNSGGGIRDFLGGIVSGIGDFFGNLFGGGGDDPGDGDATTSPSGSDAGNNNPKDFGGDDGSPGDTVVASVTAVAAVAAIAGVALVLTKKKEDR